MCHAAFVSAEPMVICDGLLAIKARGTELGARGMGTCRTRSEPAR
jgi:hypothetical protein